MTDDEIKLFINTMIASYRATAADPYVTITNADSSTNTATTIYVEDTGDSGEDTTINYKVNDDSMGQFNRSYNVTITRTVGTTEETLVAGKSVAKGSVDTIPVSYKDIKANEELTYTITLESSYFNDTTQKTVTTKSTKTVHVVLLPLFDLY
jgi:hypothetical protein